MTYTGNVWVQLREHATNLLVGSPFMPITTDTSDPVLKEFLSHMKAAEEAGDKDASASVGNYNAAMLNAWLGLQAVEQVASKMTGDITPEAFLTAVKTAKVRFGDVMPPVDFAKPLDGGPVYQRIFNPIALAAKWNPTEQGWTVVPDSSINFITGEATSQ
jgi:hypothetical protein